MITGTRRAAGQVVKDVSWLDPKVLSNFRSTQRFRRMLRKVSEQVMSGKATIAQQDNVQAQLQK